MHSTRLVDHEHNLHETTIRRVPRATFRLRARTKVMMRLAPGPPG